jgi:hypothetical protein
VAFFHGSQRSVRLTYSGRRPWGEIALPSVSKPRRRHWHTLARENGGIFYKSDYANHHFQHCDLKHHCGLALSNPSSGLGSTLHDAGTAVS